MRLEKQSGADWLLVGEEVTNADGRISFACPAEAASYRLSFLVAAYFEKNQVKPFFLDVPISFRIEDLTRKYHIPLLLNPFGFSVYRGS